MGLEEISILLNSFSAAKKNIELENVFVPLFDGPDSDHGPQKCGPG